MTIAADIQTLNPGSIVELFVLDATALGGTINRFHSGVNELSANVVWKANSYSPLPLKAEGFERTGQGLIPRPTLTISNISGLIATLIQTYDDLIGAKLTRERTMIKYLDAVNFGSGNPDADPSVFFPDEVYFVNQKISENKAVVEFELSAAWDVHGVKLPRRQILQNICPWVYRSAECSYAGGAVAELDDTPTAILDDDECGKRIASCKLRFGANGLLPFGGFPGSGLIR
jgi:lambda family phage minor tail protein L